MYTPILYTADWEIVSTQISVNGQTVAILNQTMNNTVDTGTSNLLLPTDVTEVNPSLPSISSESFEPFTSIQKLITYGAPHRQSTP